MSRRLRPKTQSRQAETALDRGRPTRSDVILHGEIGRAAQPSAGGVERQWDDALVAGIEGPVGALTVASGAVLERAWHGQEAAVEACRGQLAARADALAARVGAASRALAERIEGSESEARVFSYGLSTAVALALVALILSVATLRRRGMRGRN